MRPNYVPVEMDEKAETERPLLNDISESESLIYSGLNISRKDATKVALTLHTLLLLFNLLLITGGILYLKYRDTSPEYSRYEYAPLKDVVKYRPEYWDLTLGDRSEYTQSPSEEVDEAWYRITAPPGYVGFVMATQDEMEQMNVTSVKAKDGSGYLVTIDVFHQLHCLDFLRRTIYNASYYHIDSNSTHTLHDEHVAHCIDSIRLSLQCHADTSVVPFSWIPNYIFPWPDFRSTHQCRNFDNILAFAKENFFDAGQHKDLFVHPLLGEYVEGGWKGDPTGWAKEGSKSWEVEE